MFSAGPIPSSYPLNLSRIPSIDYSFFATVGALLRRFSDPLSSSAIRKSEDQTESAHLALG